VVVYSGCESEPVLGSLFSTVKVWQESVQTAVLLLSVADVEGRSQPENRQTNNGYQFDLASYTCYNSLFLCPNRLLS